MPIKVNFQKIATTDVEGYSACFNQTHHVNLEQPMSPEVNLCIIIEVMAGKTALSFITQKSISTEKKILSFLERGHVASPYPASRNGQITGIKELNHSSENNFFFVPVI
ncbi:hypothetical protein TNCV_3086371 [Trichonephila clavipes]|nr:hypothetical protein TNCV_3086371 [Trichonephila clavipes]